MADQITGLLSPWLREKRFQKAKEHLKGKILDYGCGIGGLTAHCNANNYVGYDSDQESINIAQANYPNFRFHTTFPKSEKFDTIVGLAVIEHIANPGELLAVFKNMIEPGGSIVLTTPNSSFRWIDDFGSKIGLLSPDKDDHEDFIGYKEMKNMADKAGLEITVYKKFLFGANQLIVLTKA